MQIYINSKDLFKLGYDFKNIDKNFPKLGENIRKGFANRTKKLAKDNVQPRWNTNGTLKSSIIFRKEGTNKTMVIAGTPYAGYVEMGTNPHKMRFPPFSKGDMLSRYWKHEVGKKYIPGSDRMHSGAGKGKYGPYPSMHFMERAFNQTVIEADGIIQKEVDKFFNQRGF